LAELGFIVVRVDGLGTSGRSKEFHNHSYKNMGNNLEDHVLAIKHLANKYSWIDIDKVGIYGHSAGGYDTGRALLGFPDFYKVGVASSGDHDFRMEKRGGQKCIKVGRLMKPIKTFLILQMLKI